MTTISKDWTDVERRQVIVYLANALADLAQSRGLDRGEIINFATRIRFVAGLSAHFLNVNREVILKGTEAQ